MIKRILRAIRRRIKEQREKGRFKLFNKEFNLGKVRYRELTKESLQYALYHPKGNGKKQYQVNFHDGTEMIITHTREQSFEDIIGPTQLFQYYYIEPFLRKDHRVLDVACGTGYGSNWLKSKVDLVIGVDINETIIMYATKRYPGITFIKSNGKTLPFKDYSFDIIVSVETIEHVKDDQLFLKELHRVLRKGGQLLITTPHIGLGNPFHIREYRTRELEDRLSEYFRPKKWKWINKNEKNLDIICTK